MYSSSCLFRALTWACLVTIYVLHEVVSEASDTVHPLGEGHLKPFGKGNPSKPVTTIEGFPTTREFFTEYVADPKPLVMKRAILNSRSVRLWYDDYFLGLTNIPSDHTVLIESRKKENRTVMPSNMHFQEFVKIYNHTDQYMVDPVPNFLKQDVMVPGPLQCDQLLDTAIVENMMWFSSGGTSSVVHTDSVENINCLMAGNKTFVIVPSEYEDHVNLDRPEGAYSDIDVDAVSYDDYPGMAEVKQFLHAEMEPGDCLYIPYKWIHQVRSFGRNIAVNVWWDTSKNAELNLDACSNTIDSELSLQRAIVLGFDMVDASPAVIRDHIAGAIKRSNKVTLDDLLNLGFYPEEEDPGEFAAHPEYSEYKELLQTAFTILDADKNNILSSDDLEAATEDTWAAVTTQINLVKDLIDELFPPEDEEEEDEETAHDEL